MSATEAVPLRRPLAVTGGQRVALLLAAVAVVVQITYPLLSGHVLITATVTSVLVFAAASLISALATHGLRAAAALALGAGGVGLLAEAVGVSTGFPFGDYAYAGTLRPQVLGVPAVVPAAWLMMAWPTMLAGRSVVDLLRRRFGPVPHWAAVPLAAWLLTAWDLSLDPQMVAAGHWSWEHPAPALPGIPGIPLTNYAGWLLVSLVVHAVLHVGVPRGVRRGVAPGAAIGAGAPALLLGWTWLGSALGNAVFFGRPWVALWVFVAMGLVALPALAHLRHRAPGRSPTS
ncbi:putative membrane protein [Quadrisphaera granulorum]|uniref:Putative membrane protein n=1 Tax=Quadrisphaera granulorum TaxID=317664 RepID=A0A316AU60_9ACTN|nr:carotenoid biosynthesis protein [Quadrisphaera granulorum]PWJ53697.1 putative membrane protein [Quadrisphaera granulorum]SZE96741.1 putative membrane protein [Quadrisphaera granulorum]